MIEMEVSKKDLGTLERALANLSGQKFIPAIMNAQKRAATAGRTAASKKIRQIYTIKAGDLKSRARIKAERGAMETRIEVKGPFEPASKYTARRNARGVFVAIKRGGGHTVPRSFDIAGTFVAREGAPRLPVHMLFGPAVPQLFGNEEVLEEVQARALEIYEKRLYHELERRLNA